jgi:hypothetical protein
MRSVPVSAAPVSGSMTARAATLLATLGLAAASWVVSLRQMKGDGHGRVYGYGAAQESNLPSVGLPRLTGFEDRLGHRAHAAPGQP